MGRSASSEAQCSYPRHSINIASMKFITVPFTEITIFYIKYLTLCTKCKMHAGAIKKLLNGMCNCMGDNPLAKACGLSSGTGAQIIQYG